MPSEGPAPDEDQIQCLSDFIASILPETVGAMELPQQREVVDDLLSRWRRPAGPPPPSLTPIAPTLPGAKTSTESKAPARSDIAVVPAKLEVSLHKDHHAPARPAASAPSLSRANNVIDCVNLLLKQSGVGLLPNGTVDSVVLQYVCGMSWALSCTVGGKPCCAACGNFGADVVDEWLDDEEDLCGKQRFHALTLMFVCFVFNSCCHSAADSCGLDVMSLPFLWFSPVFPSLCLASAQTRLSHFSPQMAHPLRGASCSHLRHECCFVESVSGLLQVGFEFERDYEYQTVFGLIRLVCCAEAHNIF